MIVYGTFKGFKNYVDEPSKFIWEKLIDETGNPIKGIYLSTMEDIFNKVKMKFGERFMITYGEHANRNIYHIDNIRLVNKNPRCDIFRRFKNEFHIINGKYKGQKDIDIPDEEMSSYCIWLVRHSNNEATIINCLVLLEKIKNNSKL